MNSVNAEELLAGVARVDITNTSYQPANDPLYVKALVLRQGSTTAVIVTVDAVAIEEIGSIAKPYLENVRAALKKELNILPESVLVNASHCHGYVCADVDQRTIQAVREAAGKLVPVRVGAGSGQEIRIMENRRVRLKDGRDADMRRAYSMPRDEEVATIGPVDPEIGLLRLDRMDGQPFAVIYNFACHPIHGVPNGGNTADFPGFASRVIEENFGENVMAFFIQGCAGDINPLNYKAVNGPPDCEPYGNLLGLSALRALRSIKTIPDAPLKIVNQTLQLPRAAHMEHRISAMLAEQSQLLRSLTPTTLNFKTFLPLYLQYRLSDDTPLFYSHLYLREKSLGQENLVRYDANNRALMDAYVKNIRRMEQLTILQTNLDLLRKNLAKNQASGSDKLDVEVGGLRVGDFLLITFPGELTVEVGLNIKQRSAAPTTFVAGYTNGYIYYTPTVAQRNNPGYAQEDCDCIVAPEWQKLFEDRAAEVLTTLQTPAPKS
ncbi:MAG: hypothetical protein ACK526_09630 [Planctomyces sp.]